MIAAKMQWLVFWMGQVEQVAENEKKDCSM
jgi:hypothetical protein